MRLLVVDGDPAARAATVSVLQTIYPTAEIVDTGDGMEAVQISLNTPVDAVYTEVLMPRISGFDVARLVQKFRPEAAAYVVSGTDKFFDRAQGLSGYYLKPLTRDEFQRGDLLAQGKRVHI